MKYLVTFAYSQKTNIITGFEFDAYSERDYPIEKKYLIKLICIQ